MLQDYIDYMTIQLQKCYKQSVGLCDLKGMGEYELKPFQLYDVNFKLKKISNDCATAHRLL